MVLARLDSTDSEPQTVRLGDYLRLEQIVELKDCHTRDQAIAQMLEQLAEHQLLEDINSVRYALTQREQHVSTAIGKGIALPHARLLHLRDFMVCVGLYPQGICWGSGDHEPVRLIFMVLGPDDKQLEYLRLVSQIANIVREEHTRKLILGLQRATELFKLFKKSSI